MLRAECPRVIVTAAALVRVLAILAEPQARARGMRCHSGRIVGSRVHGVSRLRKNRESGGTSPRIFLIRLPFRDFVRGSSVLCLSGVAPAAWASASHAAQCRYDRYDMAIRHWLSSARLRRRSSDPSPDPLLGRAARRKAAHAGHAVAQPRPHRWGGFAATKKPRFHPQNRGWMTNLVPHTGFEPVISALRGRCPRPLDECGTVVRRRAERIPREPEPIKHGRVTAPSNARARGQRRAPTGEAPAAMA